MAQTVQSRLSSSPDCRAMSGPGSRRSQRRRSGLPRRMLGLLGDLIKRHRAAVCRQTVKQGSSL